MLEYHKINSVYMRDPATKNKSFIEGAWSQPEFEYLAAAEWVWTEKIDGTNMRVEYLNGKVNFGGRTSAAQIPAFLVEKMLALFPAEKVADQFKDAKYAVTLFGEGYGAKIQKGGGNYKPDGVDFILFDVAFGGAFAARHVVEQITREMGLDVVPIIGKGTLPEAIEYTLAGGVIAQSLGKNPGHCSYPQDYNADTKMKLEALENFRAGDVGRGLFRMDIYEQPMGGYSRLNRKIPPYELSRGDFYSAMESLAYDLESVGL